MAPRDISFCSFNLLNLQLPGRPVYTNATGWTPDVYDRKITFTARMLTRLDADVFGFQELWAPEALQQAMDLAAMNDSHILLTPPGHRGDRIVCAAMVRRDMLVGEPEWITSFPPEMVLKSGGDDPQQAQISVNLSSFSRPVLRLRVRPAPAAPEITVFVCHFKSRRPAEIWRERDWYDAGIHANHRTALGYALSTIRRTAEAAALRVLITNITKGTETPVVLIGDMNDGKDSNTLNILTEQPRYLSTLAMGGGDNALYTAQVLQEYRSTRDVYYTHIWQDQRESLDHILVSEQFYDNSRRRIWRFDDMIVMNDYLNWDDHKISGTTDHGIILARFKWRPAQPGIV
ncbi:endonuclease/exonuclease/phosphatase family protein [Paracoccus sp. (in: a-proteobacteria)]|uniref:endonuclease/exonuclease/phosphatase family protein n=1 Tax=Paracoccus sp. TaxID=267 RepID=UPI0026E0115A|nr:endonuclease/exonuclease/phosphatase family protein [Paracoccus sp. (in: a-proteobacteria)]MDO5646566.1 endonuclease/exonuclease/phosphatase family protein [Paracoccus sp. (in: a-proteobacteria)]